MAKQERRSRTVTLTLPTGPDRERAVRAARRWFEVCPAGLHAAFETAHATVGVAVFHDAYPEPREWNADWSPAAWEEFLRRLGRLPDAAGLDEPQSGYGVPPAPDLSSIGLEPVRESLPSPASPGAPDRRRSVGLLTDPDHLDLFSTIDDTVADDQILATVREVAEIGAPLAVAVAVKGQQRLMPLEEAIGPTNTTYVRKPAETLRNYGWLTVLGDDMAERVGGADRLRASGAFVEVEPLSAGGWWLLATKTWDEYGQEQADRLFELLAPVLPPGKPQMTQWRVPLTEAGPFEVTLPNVVAERDPREITG